jgi:hypothetical protein
MSDAWSQAATTPAQAPAQTTSHLAAGPRVVPRASFNFAAAAWEAKQREQKLGLVVLAVVSLVFGWVGYGGHSAGKEATSLQSSIDGSRLQQRQADAKIVEITGGIEDLPGLVASKQRGVDFVFSNDIDVAEVMKIVSSAVIPGVTIISVRIVPRGEATSASVEKISSSYLLEVRAEGPDLEAPAMWQEAVSKLAGTKLESPVVSYSIENQGVALSLSAGLIDDVVLLRRNDSRTQVGVPPATTQPPATTAPTGEGDGGGE